MSCFLHIGHTYEFQNIKLILILGKKALFILKKSQNLLKCFDYLKHFNVTNVEGKKKSGSRQILCIA